MKPFDTKLFSKLTTLSTN